MRETEFESEFDLESLGLLRMVEVPPAYKWLTNEDKYVLVYLALLAGPDGLSKKRVAEFEKNLAGSPTRLFANGLTEWVTDNAGRNSSMVLSWKGQDVARALSAVARTKSAKETSK